MKRVFRYNGKDTLSQLSKTIKRLGGDSPVYFCVGSDKVLFDSIGPKVGTRLKERSNGSLTVYGVEGDAINALNVRKAYKIVRGLHPQSKIIVVDASVSDNKGTIRIKDKGIRPGSGVGKNLGKIGDLSILCCTTVNPNRIMFEETVFNSNVNPDDIFYREPTKRMKRFQKFIDAAADVIVDAILLAAA